MRVDNLRRACLVLTALVGTAAGATAAEPERPHFGMFAEISGWWVTPRSQDLDYAFVDGDGLSGGGEIVTLEPDRDGALRLRGGWRFDAPGDPRLSLTLWEVDVDSASDTGVRVGEVGALLSSPDFSGSPAFFPPVVDFASATSRLRATTADVDFAWNVAGEDRGRLRLELGIRWFQYEEERIVTYRRLAPPSELEELIIVNVETDGVGPRAGLAYAYPVSRRVEVGARLGVAFPLTTSDASASDAVYSDGTFVIATAAEREGAQSSLLQIDAGLGVGVRIWKGLAATFSYEVQRWEGVSTRQRFVDVVGQSTTVRVEEDVAFEGFVAGLRYEF